LASIDARSDPRASLTGFVFNISSRSADTSSPGPVAVAEPVAAGAAVAVPGARFAAEDAGVAGAAVAAPDVRFAAEDAGAAVEAAARDVQARLA
jgi:hypothetical protein